MAAQECNYAKDMRRYISEHKSSGLSTSLTLPEDEPSTQTQGPGQAQQQAQQQDQTQRQQQEQEQQQQQQEQGLESAEPGQRAAAATEEADSMHATRQFGSTRAMLKSKLVDAVDSSAMWERHISSTLGDQ